MADRRFTSNFGSVNDNRLAILCGNFTIGSSGAVSSESGAQDSGGTVTQVDSEDGRYLVSFYKTFRSVVSAHVTMVGDDDDALPTTTGVAPFLRATTAGAGILIQFIRSDTSADADPASGTVCYWTAIVEVGS